MQPGIFRFGTAVAMGAALAMCCTSVGAQNAPKSGGKPQPGSKQPEAKAPLGKNPDGKQPGGAKPDGKDAPPPNERLKDLFNRLDDNHDGFVTKREFGGMARIIGGRNGERQAERLFTEADANKDGKLTLEETTTIGGKLGPRFRGPGKEAPPPVDPVRVQVQRQFTALDRDRNGLISEAEARTNKDLKARFKQIDTDLDGSLSLEEVVEFVKAQQAEKQ